MKKFISLILCFSIALSLSACNSAREEELSTLETSGQSTVQKGEKSNILIAYFTWAENTQVENPDAVDLDASTSASVLLPGNTAKLAGFIKQKTGGDLFSIIVSQPYSSDYDECLARAADEKAENARPEIVNHIYNMADYDIVFLGYPNWWYTAPMAVFSFLEEYDFSGKTIIPFCAHGTGGLASSVEDIKKALPASSSVYEALGVYRPDIDSAGPAVNEWLESLGFKENSSEETGGEEITEPAKDKKIIMELDGQELSVTLCDTPAANALYDMLPLTLSFEDFNGIEKIAYLPDALPTDGEPDGCTPSVGDLCLYAPWGNLSVFYQNFRYSSGLVLLGSFDSDIKLLSDMTSDFNVHLKKSA